MKRKIKGGDCYYIAGQFAMDNVFSPKKIDYKGTPYLVHAEVQGQGKVSNLRYGHAWIEDDENVYDFSNGRELIIPKVLYYAIGDIRTNNPKKYQKYTFSEARKRMLQYKHYGCWDLDVEYKEGGSVISSELLLAPNGKPTNLTPEQYKLVRTPEFKAWFGDWENSPEMASKVVDEETKEPKVMYHGSKNDFTIFNPKAEAINRRQNFEGFYFTGDKNRAKSYSNVKLFEVFINIRNPLNRHLGEHLPSYKSLNYIREKYKGDFNKEYLEEKMFQLQRTGRNSFIDGEDMTKILIMDNYDGVFDGSFDYGDTVAFKSNQIKLADGTNTTFDSNNPDIRYEIGGIFQGTPYEFDKYSTDYMGTGEGQQVFGWGLYFTDIKDIAKQYAKNELLIEKEIAKKSNDSAHLWIYSNVPSQVKDKLAYLKNELNDLEEKQSQYPKLDLADKIKTYRDLIDIIENYKGKVYSVTLFKGENESDYDLLLWDSPVNVEQLEKIFIEAEKIGGIPLKEGWYFSETKYGITPELLAEGYSNVNLFDERSSVVKGDRLYSHLAKELGSDKEASLFLLRAGIDGIKYKSGTLSGMADKEGYNYVIFDADDATIENKELYKNGGLTIKEPTKFWGDSAAGVLLICKKTGRVLLFHRSEDVYEPETWGIISGKIDEDENPKDAILRELIEETKLSEEDANRIILKPSYVYKKGSFTFYNYLGFVENEFAPTLNWENTDYKWCDIGEYPNPLHFGVLKLLENVNLKKEISGELLAPNGKPTNLTAEQYKLVRTSEFKAWFGDWEKSPKKASKVVDENGEPLVVWHYSDKKFNRFKTPTFFAEIKNSYKTKILKNEYGVFLSIKNPLELRYKKLGKTKFFDVVRKIFESVKFKDGEALIDEDIEFYMYNAYEIKDSQGFYKVLTDFIGGYNWDWAFDYAKNENYGGIVYNETDRDLTKLFNGYAVFEPSQIKLADGINTTFDSNNPDIRYADGGTIPDLLSSQEVEYKLGRELDWWNDDIVYLSGIKYKKVFLRPEYKKVIE
jgi:8-oxo-dGTP pyrophosphatase MutT (NUDIX family)